MTRRDDAMGGYDAGVAAGRRLALAELDLRDPETENAVAAAIARHNGGGYVPLADRYPWLFPQIPPGRCAATFDPSPELHYLCELRAGHAGMHEATLEAPSPGALPDRAEWIDRQPLPAGAFDQRPAPGRWSTPTTGDGPR